MPVRTSEMLEAYEQIDRQMLRVPPSVRLHLYDAMDELDVIFANYNVTPPRREFTMGIGYVRPPRTP